MPHQCTTCGRTFPDGSKEMLSGCPDCGGNKFQFKPAGESTGDKPSPAGDKSSLTGDKPSPARDKPSDVDSQSPAADRQPGGTDEGDASPDSRHPDSQTADSSASDSADSPASDSTDTSAPDSEQVDSEHVRERDQEDVAQASARSDVVSPDELDQASQDVESDSPTQSGSDASGEPEGPRPDIDDLRDELNEQFESIRIVSPGKYELNLMELYDRQEYIISLQEDGRYVIEMPDAWGITDE